MAVALSVMVAVWVAVAVCVRVKVSVVVEVKAVEALAPVHEAQLLTYLKLSGLRVGLLLNFNVALFRQGIKRLVR